MTMIWPTGWLLTAMLVNQTHALGSVPKSYSGVASLPASVPPALLETFELTHTYGDRFWPGYGSNRFGILLVESNRETLICDSRLPEGFERVDDEPLLSCKQSTGPSSWRQSNLLAAMPVFGPPSVIVMGTPETTGRTLNEWKMTILHEHFHQWQADQPHYYKRVEALNLSGGDQTGMWMLNYPFPYAKAPVVRLHRQASFALRKAIGAKSASDLKAATQNYLQARRAFRASVSEKDWRYLEFQLWQEGVARWTEFSIAARSRNAEMRKSAQTQRRKTLDALAQPDLKTEGRVAFYAYGAGEAMLLERIAPNWRKCYLQDMSLGPRFEKKCRQSSLK